MEDLYWKANYINRVFDTEKTGKRYEFIDRKNLISLDIMNGDKLIYRLKTIPGETLFYRRRVKKIIVGNREKGDNYWYIIGFVGKHYTIIKPDGTKIIKKDDPQITVFDYEVPS